MSQLNTISFVRNSFINFDMNGESGGIGIEVENEVNSNKLKLIYEDCSFINTTNRNNKYHGGAIHCGSPQNTGQVVLNEKNCIFNDNNNEKGGSIYINFKK